MLFMTMAPGLLPPHPLLIMSGAISYLFEHEISESTLSKIYVRLRQIYIRTLLFVPMP